MPSDRFCRELPAFPYGPAEYYEPRKLWTPPPREENRDEPSTPRRRRNDCVMMQAMELYVGVRPVTPPPQHR
jgi:hypothetical protein